MADRSCGGVLSRRFDTEVSRKNLSLIQCTYNARHLIPEAHRVRTELHARLRALLNRIPVFDILGDRVERGGVAGQKAFNGTVLLKRHSLTVLCAQLGEVVQRGSKQ